MIRPSALWTACLALALAPWLLSVAAAEVTAELAPGKDRVTVKVDGQVFAEYLARSGNKPIVWPIIGPTGKPMTRNWPMGKALPGEKTDHVHQRSLWFTHGDVNGHDFWAEAGRKERIGHREFVKITSGREAQIVTRNDWLDPDGKKVCEDERTLTFGADGASRWIDFDITLSASDGPVRFGDTKEGSMGIRMAAPLQPDAKLGGRLVNSDGLIDEKAWGKRAAWVDYSGPIDGQTVGIAMMNHPKSFRFPTHWHARTYGLAAANPFGIGSFEGNGADGSVALKPGESIRLFYRILFHKGDSREAGIDAAFQGYCTLSK